jgi:peptide/nickel transport system permease protein
MMIPVMLAVLIIVYTVCFFMPGDPVKMILGATYTEEQYIAKVEEYGLDRPYIVQLGSYMFNLITKGDMGVSFVTGRPVVKELDGRIGITLKLGILSCSLTFLIAIPIGIISAVKQNSLVDYTFTSLAVFLAAMPGFWLALMLIIVFSLKLGWLPSSGLRSWKAYILPVLCNALSATAVTMRMTRSSMLEVIRQDYISTARAKGVSETRVIIRHALRNALIPVITVIGSQFSAIIGGSVVVENIFSIQGIGSKLVSAIGNRDYQMVLGITVIICGFTMVVMLLVDLVYSFVDPRIKAEFIRQSKSGKMRRQKQQLQGNAG